MILLLQILGVAVATMIGLIAIERRNLLIAPPAIALAVWQCLIYWPAA